MRLVGGGGLARCAHRVPPPKIAALRGSPVRAPPERTHGARSSPGPAVNPRGSKRGRQRFGPGVRSVCASQSGGVGGHPKAKQSKPPPPAPPPFCSGPALPTAAFPIGISGSCPQRCQGRTGGGPGTERRGGRGAAAAGGGTAHTPPIHTHTHTHLLPVLPHCHSAARSLLPIWGHCRPPPAPPAHSEPSGSSELRGCG